MASPMLQEVFGGKLIGLDIGFNDLDGTQKQQIAAIAAGFTGLLSLCNIGGRFFWATWSDRLGRKTTYAIFFTLGFLLYASAPFSAHTGSVFLFVLSFCIILSMYGGGFATIPAYLADMFGTHMVGGIHGRLLTAWSTAGVLGPVLVNYIRDYQLDHGVPREAVYNQTLYILAGLLVLGMICNLRVRPVAERYFMTDEEVAADKRISTAAVKKMEAEPHADFEDFIEDGYEPNVAGARKRLALANGTLGTGMLALLVVAWSIVGVPLAWGVWITLQKTFALFH
jgi:MFS family permease